MARQDPQHFDSSTSGGSRISILPTNAFAKIMFVLILMVFATRTGLADQPFPAHRIAGNLYYVGSTDLASYLIATPEGHIVINSGFEETVPMIQKAIESLGFNLADVKILLASHAHSDHVAGHARLKELTGAKVYVMRGDHSVIASGGEGQYLYTDSRWTPCPVDRVLDDGEEIELGGAKLTAHLTPGHTRGCTSWSYPLTDGNHKFLAVVIGSPNVNPGYQLVGNKDYPQIADDFARTFAVLKKLPCDIFLARMAIITTCSESTGDSKTGARTRLSMPKAIEPTSRIVKRRSKRHCPRSELYGYCSNHSAPCRFVFRVASRRRTGRGNMRRRFRLHGVRRANDDRRRAFLGTSAQ